MWYCDFLLYIKHSWIVLSPGASPRKVTEAGKDRLTVDHEEIEATVYEDDFTLYEVKVVTTAQRTGK
jgi:hypothetical protein